MPSRIEQLRSESRFASPSGLHRSGTVDSERTAVGDAKVHLYLHPGTELPTVPYKLRFAISPDEWDRRLQSIAQHTQRAAKPLYEGIYFFFFCITMPAGIGYPLHRAVLDIATESNNGRRVRTDAEDKIDAVVIPCVLALILFMLFTIPLFIRKYILQGHMSHESRIWEAMDLKRMDKRVDVRWRVRLPLIFGSTSAILIPVPPRSDDDASSTFTFHSRSSSWEDVEALGGAGLARSDSIGRQTMFERTEGAGE